MIQGRTSSLFNWYHWWILFLRRYTFSWSCFAVYTILNYIPGQIWSSSYTLCGVSYLLQRRFFIHFLSDRGSGVNFSLTVSSMAGMAEFIPSVSLRTAGSIRNFLRQNHPQDEGPLGIKREALDRFIKSLGILFFCALATLHWVELMIVFDPLYQRDTVWSHTP